MSTAMMYAELSSRIPINGSAFTYTYVTFGELPAWIVGWSLNLRYGMSACGLARGMASYFNGLLLKFGLDVPQWMLGLKVFGVENCSIEAVVFLCILNFIYTRGMQESNTFNLVFTALKLVTLILIVIIAFCKFDATNLTPFTLEEEGGWAGTFFASSIIFYGYLGFDFITTLTPEAKNPARNVPFAVKTSTILCMGLYLLTSFSLAGMAPLQDYNADTAMADAFSAVGLDYVSFIVYFCAFFGITAACFTNMLVSTSVCLYNNSDHLFDCLKELTEVPISASRGWFAAKNFRSGEPDDQCAGCWLLDLCSFPCYPSVHAGPRTNHQGHQLWQPTHLQLRHCVRCRTQV